MHLPRSLLFLIFAMTPAFPESPSPEFARSALDRRLVSGVAWTAVARWGSQIVSWSAMLLLARLLSPADFGLFGMSWFLMGFIGVVSEFGIGIGRGGVYSDRVVTEVS